MEVPGMLAVDSTQKRAAANSWSMPISFSALSHLIPSDIEFGAHMTFVTVLGF